MNMVQMLCIGLSALLAFSVGSYAAPKNKPVTVVNTESEPVPVTIQGDVAAAQRVPITVSGEWDSGGLTLPSMIVHDIIFYVDQVQVAAECQFTMNYVIDVSTSRRIRLVKLAEGESVQIQFAAGIDSADLRFGTTGFCGGCPSDYCSRNWAAVGFPLE